MGVRPSRAGDHGPILEGKKKGGERLPSLLRVRELAPRCLPRAPVPRVDSTAPIRWAQAQLPDLDTPSRRVEPTRPKNAGRHSLNSSIALWVPQKPGGLSRISCPSVSPASHRRTNSFPLSNRVDACRIFPMIRVWRNDLLKHRQRAVVPWNRSTDPPVRAAARHAHVANPRARGSRHAARANSP